MNLQAILDQEALSFLPRVNAVLKNESITHHSYDNIYAIAMKEIYNTRPCLAEKTGKQIKALESKILRRCQNYLQFSL